jgi:hypothetical protein
MESKTKQEEKQNAEVLGHKDELLLQKEDELKKTKAQLPQLQKQLEDLRTKDKKLTEVNVSLEKI